MLDAFHTMRSAYSDAYSFDLMLVDAQGNILEGKPSVTDCECGNRNPARRIQAAEQTRYWGKTVLNLCCDTGYALWAVPILDNNHLKGALLVYGVDLESGEVGFYEKVQQAADELLRMALEANLLNQAELTLAQRRASEEQDRFLALEALKKNVVSDDIRSIYLVEEPELLGAIKNGKLVEARAILNRILTGIYGLAGERIELLKSCILELVVMMNRAAVEAGAEPASVLGQNYRSLAELSEIDDEEDLSTWLRRMLELLMERIRENNTFPHSLLLLRAVQHMRNNLHRHLTRDDVARVAGVSPGHFSKLMTERMGRSFSQLLSQLRVDRARELLRTTDKTLTDIALSCGFCDQSHMNKVFRATNSLSPGKYRKR